MTYPQQPFQYGGFEPPPPPPPGKKTGAVVAVVAVVVLALGGLAFTGFVAPGFLVAEEKGRPVGTTPTTTSSSADPKGADPEEFLDALVVALSTQDADALEEAACPSAKPFVDSVIEAVDQVEDAELTDSEKVSDDEVVGTIEITTDTGTGELEATVTQDDGEWCWQDAELAGGEEPSEPSEPTEPSTDPSGTPMVDGKPVDPKALATMQKFLDSVNAGDAGAAKSQLCRDAISTPGDVDELVGYEPNLRIDPTMNGIGSGERSVQLYLRGTAKGQELEGYSTNLWVTKYDGPWCVHAFRAVVV